MNRHHLLIPLTLFSFVLHSNVPCLADVCYKMLAARRGASPPPLTALLTKRNHDHSVRLASYGRFAVRSVKRLLPGPMEEHFLFFPIFLFCTLGFFRPFLHYLVVWCEIPLQCSSQLSTVGQRSKKTKNLRHNPIDTRDIKAQPYLDLVLLRH